MERQPPNAEAMAQRAFKDAEYSKCPEHENCRVYVSPFGMIHQRKRFQRHRGHARLKPGRVAVLEAFIRSLRTDHHYECQDGWYSCPKSEDGCYNDGQGDDCTCGVDTLNEQISAILGESGRSAGVFSGFRLVVDPSLPENTIAVRNAPDPSKMLHISIKPTK